MFGRAHQMEIRSGRDHFLAQKQNLARNEDTVIFKSNYSAKTCLWDDFNLFNIDEFLSTQDLDRKYTTVTTITIYNTSKQVEEMVCYLQEEARFVVLQSWNWLMKRKEEAKGKQIKERSVENDITVIAETEGTKKN